MKSIYQRIKICGFLLLALIFTACSSQPQIEETAEVLNVTSETPSAAPNVLPVQYQNPTYMVDIESTEELSEELDEVGLKVGATIVSTRGPEPLGDVLRILTRSKGFTISWASDVDRDVLVDVNIGANDDFHKSIKNLLRQVDYFHEFIDNTIIVKYKETRQFHIAMPFTTQTYKTGTGGNVLGGNDASTNVDGTIELKSDGNEFDIWGNIQANMDAIIATWNTNTIAGTIPAPNDNEDAELADDLDTSQAAMQVSTGDSMYIIDKPVGLITVSAPRPLLDRLDDYFTSLKRELYKQINIEAKIIEVNLKDNSSIGINWSSVLKNFSVSGIVAFGEELADTASGMGTVWPNDNSSSFIRSIDLDSSSFEIFLNALKEQGDTKVLSNPRISVMNGQPALLTVGKNTTYIESIDADVDSDTGIITYSTEVNRILSGVGLALTATILDDKEIVMNLVPVTSELEEPIEYRTIGLGEVGLPVVNVREISTTVKVPNGQMLVIGGLISSTKDTSGEFLPVLGDIPLMRYLFGYEEKTNEKKELIILLKPTIL